jgi:hypothetical protein
MESPVDILPAKRPAPTGITFEMLDRMCFHFSVAFSFFLFKKFGDYLHAVHELLFVLTPI